MLSLVGLFSGTLSKQLYAATLYWWSGFCLFVTSVGIFLSMLAIL
jgi:hypothetical protein